VQHAPAGCLPRLWRRGGGRRKVLTRATPAALHRGFVSSIRRNCKAHTAGEARRVRAVPPPRVSPASLHQSALHARTLPRPTGPCRRRPHTQRYTASTARAARPHRPPPHAYSGLLPPLFRSTAPAAACLRRIMTLRHHVCCHRHGVMGFAVEFPVELRHYS